MIGKRRAGAEADKQWPRILKKMGSIGDGSAAAPAAGIVPWANVSKTGSSLAHIADRDHGLLTGLGDDDHAQYVHVSSERTVAASHTWTANQRYDGSVGIGVWPPTYRLDVGDRIRLRSGGSGTAGAWFADAAGTVLGFMGLSDDTALNRTAGIWVGDWHLQVDSGGNTRFTNSVRTNSFTSGFTGNGFRVDNGLSVAGKTTAEMDDLIVRGRMRVYELLVQQIRATNGSIFVSSTGKAKTVTGTGPYSIESETTHGFLTNDLIRAQRFTGNGVYQSNAQVTGVADLTHFTASLSSGDAPAAGMEFVRLGNTTDATRQNSLYMSADDLYNPFIDVIVGVNSFSAWGSPSTRRVRIGNLQGLFLTPNEFGIFAGDGIGVANKYFRISNVTQESHNIPNKMYDSSGNLFVQMDTSGLNYYVQAASSFADNTSVMFRRPDNSKILQLVGVNNFGGSTGALWVHPGTSDSLLSVIAQAPSGKFASVTLQATVGAASSQWIFKQLSSGLVGADFPGYLSTSGNIGAGVSGEPGWRLRSSGGGALGMLVEGAARFGQGGAWGAIDGPASLGWCGFGANFYYAGNQAKYRASNYASMIFFSSDITFLTAGSGAADGNIALAQHMVISNAGNVGIGVATPLYRLDVSSRGLLRANGGLSAGLWYGDSAGDVGAFAGLDGTAITANWAVWHNGAWRVQISTTGQLTCNNDLLVNGVTRLAGGYLGLAEAAEPSTSAVYGYWFVDPADGDLKFKFKNGTVRTVATN